MNILLIVILIVFLLSLFSGYKNGFLKTVFSLVSWLVVLVICNYATPIVTDILMEKTELGITIQATVDQKVNEMLTETLESTGVSDLEATLPAELKTAILGEGGSFEQVIAGQSVLDTSSLVKGIVGIVAFIIVAIATRLALIVVDVILGIASKLPLIGPVDKLLGIACGAGKGLIWCWVILAIVSVLALTGTNTELASYISQSQILTWLQDNNVLLNLIVDIQ